MIRVLAPIDNMRFDIEDALEKQLYATVPLPFSGIDKSAAAICDFFMKANCQKGSQCPFRHVKGDKSVLCKHWLRGLCKKGDDCEFLHEYDTSKMPECFFYSKYSICGNKECEFLHLDPESKIKDCPWYDRGFCRHGPHCKNRHVRKVLCLNYLCGFCPDGPSCKFKHPKFDLPVLDSSTQQKKQLFLCDYCKEYGHKISSCFKLNPQNREIYQAKIQQQHQQNAQFHQSNAHHNENGDDNNSGASEQTNNSHFQQQNNNPRHQFNNQNFNHNNRNFNNFNNHHGFGQNLNFHQGGQQQNYEVTCFKCGDKGHYANRCNKGVLSFLRQPQEQQH